MGNLIGRRDAPIRIVEFGSFQCSFCFRLHRSFSVLREKYPDMISIRWIHAVPRSGRDETRLYALASECAAKQDRFEAFHDRVFAQPVKLGTVGEMQATAREIQVPDFSLFDACLEAGGGEASVDLQAEETLNLGITATPTWFVNGLAVGGDLPLGSIDSLIVEELRRVRGR